MAEEITARWRSVLRRGPAADAAATAEWLARTEDELDAARRWRKDTTALLRALQRDVAAQLRLAAVDAPGLPYPERLTVRHFGLHSEGEEDGLTLALFDEIGTETRRFVEIGPGEQRRLRDPGRGARLERADDRRQRGVRRRAAASGCRAAASVRRPRLGHAGDARRCSRSTA